MTRLVRVFPIPVRCERRRGTPGGGVNTPVWGALGMFAVGVTDGEVDDGPAVVVAGALDVLVVVVVVVEGLLLALLPTPPSTHPRR